MRTVCGALTSWDQQPKEHAYDRNDRSRRTHLDGTKIAWHKDRIDAWERGERIAPITIDMSLTSRSVILPAISVTRCCRRMSAR